MELVAQSSASIARPCRSPGGAGVCVSHRKLGVGRGVSALKWISQG